jgi:glycine/D-amino acid oxidase-like deaminating enzyme
MEHKTIWKEGLKKKDYPELKGVVEADVVIVGAGMAGIISAYLLTKAGKKVVVLDKKKVGAGATHYTTAFLTQIIDTDFSDLIKMFGKKDTKLITESHYEAIRLIKSIIDKEKIDCDFTWCSDFHYAHRDKDVETLKEEAEIMQDIGIDARFSTNGKKLGFPNFGYIEIKKQAKFQPMKFLYAVAEAVVNNGGEIYEKAEVTKVESDNMIVQVHTSNGKVVACHALITTYEPFNKPLQLYFKKAFYTSYVLVARIEKGRLKEGIYEDTDNPYHYFRIEKGDKQDLMIIGGEDHRSDIPVSPAKSFNALKAYLQHMLKDIPYTLERKWSGPILEPVDGLAYIGPLQYDNVLYGMAFSGNGMTYSGIAALIFRDHIFKKKNEYARIYAARRIPKVKWLLRKGRDYTQELFRGAVKNTLKHKK